MTEFQLTIIRVPRVLLLIFGFSISMTAAILLAFKIENTFLKIIAPIISFLVINFLTAYNAFSVLIVQVKDSKLYFKWREKLFCYYKKIEKVNLADIKTLVIDSEESYEVLQAIITNNSKIKLGMAKYWRKDADKFIEFLKSNSNARILDSWDLWKEKGLVKISYYITMAILLGGAVIMTWIMIDKRFEVDFSKWAMFIGSYITLIPYYLIMKSKFEQNK